MYNSPLFGGEYRKYFLPMEPTQTINLIALSLIVVMHAGVLALRLGISLGRNWNTLENLKFIR